MPAALVSRRQSARRRDWTAKLLEIRAIDAAKFALKFTRKTLDVRVQGGIFRIPLDAGIPPFRSAFYVHLGLQIGTQFCPGLSCYSLW